MDEQIFSPLDHQFARFMVRQSGLSGAAADSFKLLSKRLSASLAAGHSCLELTRDEEQVLRECSDELVSPELTTPLVLWQGRLYLQRYYRYELRLAEQLKAMAKVQYPVPGHSCGRSSAIPGSNDTGPGKRSEAKTPALACDSRTALDDCFGREEGADWQRQAAEMALQRPLAIISGGPGTGKTSTVARILGLLLLTLGPDLQIALAAPTGKAAMRLRESIARNREGLPFSPFIQEKIPTSASTLHRLLGVRRHSPLFRHNHANPLPWDVVVVDEASMVDLAMMSKLVDALKPGARLILLGDKDQLASVESGAILADCIQALPENTVTLQKSYRFNQEISAFAQAVNSNNSTAAWAMLSTDMQGATTERSLQILQEPLPGFIVAQYIRYMEKVVALSGNARPEEHMQQLFQALNRFRVLCATRRGPRGVATINHQVEQSLASVGYPCQPGSWYPGRPVMILNNDYGLNLFNGDIGICLPDRTAPSTAYPGSSFKVWFEDEEGSLRGYQPYRLPACETVFAMTIHKSQGSEFAEVLVVLPTNDSPLLTRELIYTGVTRAQTRVLIASDQAIFNGAINRAISRSSGLHAMLTHSG